MQETDSPQNNRVPFSLPNGMRLYRVKLVGGTCLYLKNLPLLVPTNIVEGREPKVWKEAPSPERKINRARTYDGIARAMAEQWGGIVSGSVESGHAHCATSSSEQSDGLLNRRSELSELPWTIKRCDEGQVSGGSVLPAHNSFTVGVTEFAV